MSGARNWLDSTWRALPDFVHSTAFILALTVVLIISVAYLTLWERKAIGFTQIRLGPNRIGPQQKCLAQGIGHERQRHQRDHFRASQKL